MTDIQYNFFLLCACLASIFLLRQYRLRYILLLSLLYGSIIGLASSVKITGILVGGSYFFVVMLYRKFVCGMSVKDAVKCLTTFAISALLSIYLINPYFWPSLKGISIRDTIQEVATVSKEEPKQIQAEIQKSMSGEYPQLSNFSRVLEFPLMFPRWKQLMDEQFAKSPSAQWGENRLATFHETFFRTGGSFPKESYVLVLGIILSGRKLINSIYRKELSESGVLLLYFGVNYVFILLFKRINFDRYYLPTVIASKIIVSVAIYESARLIWGALRRSTKLFSAQSL